MILEIKNYGMTMHLSFTDYYSGTYTGIINCEGHELHGKTFVRSYVSPRGQRMKQKVTASESYYIAELNDNAVFKTFKEIQAFYKLPKMKDQK